MAQQRSKYKNNEQVVGYAINAAKNQEVGNRIRDLNEPG